MPIESSTCKKQLQFPDRHETCTVKWDRNRQDVLPFSVADMDFSGSSCLINRLKQRLEHPVLGYTDPFPNTKRTICNWWNSKYDTSLSEKAVIYSTGVLHSYVQIIEEFTRIGDKILTFSPIYPPLFNLPDKLGRQVVFSELINDNWQMDCEDVEKKIRSDPTIRLLVLCNPHNPVSKVWGKELLEKLVMICSKYDVLLVSDEIHIDLSFTPVASILQFSRPKDAVIVLGSPVKTFNVAGIKGSFLFCTSAKIRKRLAIRFKTRGISDLNLFAYQVLEEVYGNQKNEIWLKQAKNQIWANYQLLCKKMKQSLPKVTIAPLEATYLAWIDLRAYLNNEQLKEACHRAKIVLHYGSEFGSNGEGFIRWNIACDPEILRKGLDLFIEEATRISLS